MTPKKTLITVMLTLVVSILFCGYLLSYYETAAKEKQVYEMGSSSEAPASLRMYHLIEENSKKFNIPKYILYNVAYLETRYCGPFDWNYDPSQTSSAGAQGPMQIITKYAHSYAGRKVTPQELKTDLDLNIEVSCKMLKKLYSMYGRWDLVLGYYNTGNPIVNEYANYGSTNINYKNKWDKVK